jgi:hypothetical protein
MFENMALKWLQEPKRREILRGWRKLRSGENQRQKYKNRSKTERECEMYHVLKQ